MGEQDATRNRTLRPKERAIRRLRDNGHSETDIAWRFRSTPGHIQRTLELMERPATGDQVSRSSVSQALERTVLKARADGASYAEIGARLRRSPEFVSRVEKLAGLRRALA